MPLLNFQKRFAGLVASGEKRQTIRPLRKDCRNPRPEQTLYLYTGLRTKGCRKLGEAICNSVEQLTIEKNGDIVVGIRDLSPSERHELIRADGFDNPLRFFEFFGKYYELPFYGLLIKW